MTPLIAFLAIQAPQAGIPRPEHPRPDMMRADWVNLNGTWEFAETNDESDRSFLRKASWPDRIVVPFARESKLSGLGRTGFVKNVWYRRTFRVPANWGEKRVRLHIGASDWRTTVWVNGSRITEYVGGSSPIAGEVTTALKPGENTVVIHAFDDTRSRIQPLGKQSLTEKSEGIFYTRTTGIWQTVWLEAVGKSYVRKTQVEPDVRGGRFLVGVETDGPTEGVTVRATLSASGRVVAQSETAAGGSPSRLVLAPKNPRIWEPGRPFLYDLTYEVRRNGQVVDRVQSQAGLRSVEIKGRSVLINGKRVFQRLVLDQGFYPDGVWTAPSDAELRADIQRSMQAGFNGARLHQKVFEPRFLYWADRMGYMVWGEYPSYGMEYGNPRVARPVMNEWRAIVERDRNHPSIIGWCPFNETDNTAVPLQNDTTRMTWAIDPTRPTISTSGWVHGFPDAQLLDAHDYDGNPQTLHRRWMDRLSGVNAPLTQWGRSGIIDIPFFISEFGGIGWDTAGGWGYGGTPKTEEEFFTRLRGTVKALADNPNLFGFCYTQLTDVEQEKNGVFTYDRRPKFDLAKFRAIFQMPSAYERTGPTPAPAPVPWQTLVASADGDAQPWEYTTTEPAAEWNTTTGGWPTGLAGFGREVGEVRTPWSTKDLWIRQSFDYDGAPFARAMLSIFFDNAAEVYVNGQLVWRARSGTWSTDYQGHDITTALRRALRPGKNVVAAHVHQDEGGQFLDLAILTSSR